MKKFLFNLLAITSGLLICCANNRFDPKKSIYHDFFKNHSNDVDLVHMYYKYTSKHTDKQDKEKVLVDREKDQFIHLLSEGLYYELNTVNCPNRSMCQLIIEAYKNEEMIWSFDIYDIGVNYTVIHVDNNYHNSTHPLVSHFWNGYQYVVL